MKYLVTYKVEARCVIEVEADNIEEAREKANSEFSDADFGVAENIDGEIAVIENEEGFPLSLVETATKTDDKYKMAYHHAIKSLYPEGDNTYPTGDCEAEITISSLDGLKRWEKNEHSESMAILKDITNSLLEIMSAQHNLVGKYLVDIVWSVNGEYHDSEPTAEIVFNDKHKVIEIHE